MKRFFCIILSIYIISCSFVFSGASAAAASPIKNYSRSIAEEKSYSSFISLEESSELSTPSRGGTIYNYVVEQVHYSRKEENEYINSYKLPTYFADDLLNACAITAGGAAIGHYDRVYENLIPNHSGFALLGQYIYASQGAAVNSMHQALYTRMGATSGGTSVAGYKSGFSSYVSSRGYNASLKSAYNGSTLNKAQIITALENGELLTIFMDGFSITSFNAFLNYSGYDQITYCLLVGGHVMICYGYYNVRYYNSLNQMIREDCYLYVNTGFSGMGLALVNINKYITIDDGYVTDIY